MKNSSGVAAIRSSPQLLGILCIVTGMVAVISSDTVIKWLADQYALHQIVLVRSIVAVVLSGVFVHLGGGLHRLRSSRLKLHLTRGALMVIANLTYLLALAALPLAEVMTLFFVAPLFITALSVPVLGEYVGPHRWAAILIGMVGVVVMLRPGQGVLQWVSVLPVIAAFAYACMQMVTRRLGTTDSAATMAFYVQVCFIFISVGFGLVIGDGSYAQDGNTTLAFLFRAWVWPTAIDLALMAFSGCCIGVGGYLLSQAYRVAEANVVAPFEYTALPWGALLGYLLWRDVPDMAGLAGLALIVGAGLYILYRENIRRRRPEDHALNSK